MLSFPPMRTSLINSFLLMGLAGGCTGSGQVSYSGEVQTPELIEINPGVQVVADYDEPIFYSENYYWRNQGGVWYRSQYHTRGWARFDAAPAAVVHIQTPQAYVHFHGHAGGGAEVRDHREMAPPPPSPEVRDHRDMAPPPTKLHP